MASRRSSSVIASLLALRAAAVRPNLYDLAIFILVAGIFALSAHGAHEVTAPAARLTAEPVTRRRVRGNLRHLLEPGLEYGLLLHQAAQFGSRTYASQIYRHRPGTSVGAFHRVRGRRRIDRYLQCTSHVP